MKYALTTDDGKVVNLIEYEPGIRYDVPAGHKLVPVLAPKDLPPLDVAIGDMIEGK